MSIFYFGTGARGIMWVDSITHCFNDLALILWANLGFELLFFY